MIYACQHKLASNFQLVERLAYSKKEKKRVFSLLVYIYIC
jgi:hypothetical protein